MLRLCVKLRKRQTKGFSQQLLIFLTELPAPLPHEQVGLVLSTRDSTVLHTGSGPSQCSAEHCTGSDAMELWPLASGVLPFLLVEKSPSSFWNPAFTLLTAPDGHASELEPDTVCCVCCSPCSDSAAMRAGAGVREAPVGKGHLFIEQG